MGKKTNDPLFDLANFFAEDIIAASDEELLREAAEDYGDPLALAMTFDKLITAEKIRVPRLSTSNNCPAQACRQRRKMGFLPKPPKTICMKSALKKSNEAIARGG